MLIGLLIIVTAMAGSVIPELQEMALLIHMGFRIWIPSYVSVPSDPTPSIHNVTLPTQVFQL